MDGEVRCEAGLTYPLRSVVSKLLTIP
jgi:hypothetical protein